MFKVIDAKSTGKTKELIRKAAATGGTIVCAHPENIGYKCIAYNLPRVNAVYYTEDLSKIEGDIYIDEIEDYIRCNLGKRFVGYTLSNED